MLAVSAALAVVAAAAPGHAAGLALEANAARAHSRWGAELGAGFNFGGLGLSVRPMVGAFISDGDSDRFERDPFDDCRDTRDGSLESGSRCDSKSVKPYGRIEATYSIPLVAELGAGVRISSEKLRPYGTVAFNFLPLVKLKANVGPKYYALGLGVDF